MNSDNILIEKKCTYHPENTELYMNIIYNFLRLFLPEITLKFKNVHHSDFFKCDTDYDFDVEFLPECNGNDIELTIGFKRQWDKFSRDSNNFKHSIMIGISKTSSNHFLCTVCRGENGEHCSVMAYHEGSKLNNIKNSKAFDEYVKYFDEVSFINR